MQNESGDPRATTSSPILRHYEGVVLGLAFSTDCSGEERERERERGRKRGENGFYHVRAESE